MIESALSFLKKWIFFFVKKNSLQFKISIERPRKYLSDTVAKQCPLFSHSTQSIFEIYLRAAIFNEQTNTPNWLTYTVNHFFNYEINGKCREKNWQIFIQEVCFRKFWWLFSLFEGYTLTDCWEKWTWQEKFEYLHMKLSRNIQSRVKITTIS